MVDGLWMHISRNISEKKLDVDRPWRDNIRCQIFCQNQEEYDYLSSLNLMHGREIQIDIWEGWVGQVLPIAYTTFQADLRGY